MYDDFDDNDEYREDYNIDRVCTLMRDAWRLVPRLNLTEFLTQAIPGDWSEMTGEELEELLEEFIHQNE